jgi:sulfide dehydrogenase cytochrome subunit
MDIKVTKSVFMLFIMLMFNPTAWAVGDAPPLLVGTCVGCHGHEGSSMGPSIPTIAGFDVETFIHIMKTYRDGKQLGDEHFVVDEHPATIMERIAKGYTDAQIEVMAKYFGSKPFVRQPQKVDEKKVKRGRILHKQYCEKCHEQDGHVDVDEGTILAGQWMPYLKHSLIDFQLGSRKLPREMSRRLRMMIRRYGHSSVDDVVNFYGSQKY